MGMGMGMGGMSPEMMQQAMNSPMMQAMLSDPELLRSILSQNPGIAQVRGVLQWQQGFFLAAPALFTPF
jgi:hypothetical protein